MRSRAPLPPSTSSKRTQRQPEQRRWSRSSTPLSWQMRGRLDFAAAAATMVSRLLVELCVLGDSRKTKHDPKRNTCAIARMHKQHRKLKST